MDNVVKSTLQYSIYDFESILFFLVKYIIDRKINSNITFPTK